MQVWMKAAFLATMSFPALLWSADSKAEIASLRQQLAAAQATAATEKAARQRVEAGLAAAAKERQALAASLTKLGSATHASIAKQTAATLDASVIAASAASDASVAADKVLSEQKLIADKQDALKKSLEANRWTTLQSLITAFPAIIAAITGAIGLLVALRVKMIAEKTPINQVETANAVASNSATTDVKLHEIHVLVDGNLSKARIEVLDLKDEVSRLKQEISRLLPDDMRLTLEARMAIDAASSARATSPAVPPVAPLKRE